MNYFFLALCCFVSVALGQQNQKESSVLVVENQEEIQYSFTLPEGWVKGGDVAGVDAIFVSPEEEGDTFAENVNVVLEPAAARVDSVEQLYQASIPFMELLFENLTILSKEEIEIAGVPAIYVRYQCKVGDVSVDNDVVFLIRNEDEGYVITGSMLQGESREQYQEVIRAMILSLTFSE